VVIQDQIFLNMMSKRLFAKLIIFQTTLSEFVFRWPWRA